MAGFEQRVRTVFRVSELEGTGEPCWRCQARADVGCRHRPAEGAVPQAIADVAVRKDGRQMQTGQGLAFHPDRKNESNLQALALALKPLRAND